MRFDDREVAVRLWSLDPMPAGHRGYGWLDVRDGIKLLAHSRRVPDHFSQPSLGVCLLGVLTQSPQTILRLTHLAFLIGGESVRTCLGHAASVPRAPVRASLTPGWRIPNLSLPPPLPSTRPSSKSFA